MPETVYLDYAASAPLDPRVADEMNEVARLPGNPSSVHGPGRELRRRVDLARQSVADLVGAEAATVIFTSGATEANNLAIAGLYDLAVGDGAPGRILTSPFEHASVGAAIRRLAAKRGATVDLLPVGPGGRIDPADVARLVRPDTLLVAVMWVNNVLGLVQPIAEIGRSVAAIRAARGPGGAPLFFHCDAVQAAGRLPINAVAARCDSLALSAHKLYGPKGVGALYLRRGLAIEPLILGGGQEEGRRSGTENAAGIVGFGKAAVLSAEALFGDGERARALRQRLVAALAKNGRYRVLAAEGDAVANIIFLQSDRLDGENLALRLDMSGIAVSSGSACDAGSRKPSTAVRAAFGERAAIQGGIRVSFGRFTTEQDIDRLVAVLLEIDG